MIKSLRYRSDYRLISVMANWAAVRKAVDLANDVATSLAPFIAGPRPSNPVTGAYHDYTRWLCDSWANVPEWARGLAEGAASWAEMEMSIGTACAPYLGAGAPSPVPPFAGGQCPGIAYTVLITGMNAASPPAEVTLHIDPGVTGPVSCSVEQAEFFPGSSVQTWWVTINGTRTNTAFVANCSSGPSCVPGQPQISVTRNDGLPDDCGNPRPKRPTKSPSCPPDPGDPPGGGDPPTWGPGGPVFHPGPIESPYDEPDIPVPPIDPYDPTGGGEDDPYYGPGNPKPGEPGDPGGSEDTGEGGDAEGTAPDGSELSSLKIEFASVPSEARRYVGDYYRAPCYVLMGDNAGLDLDFSGSLMRDGQLVLAERPRLNKWKVIANPGFNVRVTPYYRKIEDARARKK